MSEFSNIEDFLGHSSNSGRGGKFLKSWTDKGSIRIWLHTRRFPIARWSHNIPQLVVFEDKDTRAQMKAYWGRPHICWEDETFLKSQYRRDDEGELEDGRPKKCSICRLVDVIYRGIASGQVDWTAPVFRFEGSSDPKNDQVLHAGGITGLFNSNKLSDEQKAHLKSKGIRQSEAWRENAHAKLQYVFCVVDHDDLKSGVQIAPQAGMVGDKLKSVIADARASLGDEDGNPMVNPFCIELTYDEKAPINKRYHARRIEKHKMTPEIERLIRSEPPDLSQSMLPFNQKSLRAFLERHAVIDLPWDQIFDVPVFVPAGAEEDPGEEPQGVPEKRPQAAPPPAPSSRRAVNMVPCEACKKPMPEDATKCEACGATYTFDDEPAPPQPPPVKGKVTGDKLPFDKF